MQQGYIFACKETFPQLSHVTKLWFDVVSVSDIRKKEKKSGRECARF